MQLDGKAEAASSQLLLDVFAESIETINTSFMRLADGNNRTAEGRKIVSAPSAPFFGLNAERALAGSLRGK